MASSPTDIVMATLLPMVGLPMLAGKMLNGDEGAQPAPGAPALPKDATQNEKDAQKAATDAKKRQMQMAKTFEGRGSTILTGGKLGELGDYNEKPKGLLGL